MVFDVEYKKIMEAFKKTPPLYRPSKFWEVHNDKNDKQLKDFGYGNFKQTVNTNYFQSTIEGVRDPYFLFLLHEHSKKEWITMPFASKLLNYSGSFFKKMVYKSYLCMLYEHVAKIDSQHALDKVKEPEVGNPVKLIYKDRVITQDILSSALEFYAMEEATGLSKKDSLKIAEIGAGSGRVGYFLLSLFKDKNFKYCVFDIP